MYAFWLINFMNFSKHHRQTCKHLSRKSTNGPALPRNLQFKKRSWLKGNGLHHDDVIKWKHFLRYCMAICAGNSPVLGEFPTQRPVTRSFDVFFDLRLNKRLSKQSWSWWFETLSRPLWRHRNVLTGCRPWGIANSHFGNANSMHIPNFNRFFPWCSFLPRLWSFIDTNYFQKTFRSKN